MNSSEFIEGLLVHEYDPIKRREYYLRTRKLKGRKTAGQPSTAGRSKAKGKATKTAAQRRKEVAKNLEALKVRLEALRSILRDLVAEAKKRSGVKTPEKKTKESSSTKSKEPSKLTAKQKADARKRSKEYYEKNKGTPQEQVKQIKAQIKTIQEKIETLRAQLKGSTKKNELKSVSSSTSSK